MIKNPRGCQDFWYNGEAASALATPKLPLTARDLYGGSRAMPSVINTRCGATTTSGKPCQRLVGDKGSCGWHSARRVQPAILLESIPSSQIFTGIPCKRGHIAPRMKSNRRCVVCLRESAKIRRSANPERNRILVRAQRANRRARRYGAKEAITPEDIKNVFHRHGSSCLACGSVNDIVIDHVIPLKSGGRNHIDNLQPLCARCNRKKSIHLTDYRRGSQAPT